MQNRRDFFKAGATLGVGATVAGILPRHTVRAAEHPIKYRKLGSTGFDVSEIGFGAMNTRDAELVRAAVEAGINYFDTAHVYMNGANEQIVGGVLKNYRDNIFLTTKLRGGSAAEISTAMEISLGRLQTDHVDLVLLHNIRSTADITNEEVMRAFEDIKRKGQARFIGFSGHQFPDDMADAMIAGGVWDAVLMTYNYLSPANVKESIRKVRAAGKAVIAMKTVLNVNANQALMDRAGAATREQALLRWVLDDPNVDVVIPGMTSFEHLEADLAVMSMKLAAADRATLRRVADATKGNACCGIAGCTGCTGACPKGVAVHELNRCVNYATGYGDLRLAHENYQALPASSRVDVCADCDECAVACINGLNLTDRIRQAREMFA